MSEPDFDLLADYVGGALAGTPEHDRVAALVATDPGWAREHESLVRALAATADDLVTFAEQTAEPMPDEVLARLLATLASPAVAAAPSVGARPRDNRAPASRRPLSSPRPGGRPDRVRRRPRWLSWAAPALVAVVVAAFAGLWINQSVGTGTTANSAGGAADTAAQAPESSYAQAVPRFTSGLDYTDVGVAGGFSAPAKQVKPAQSPSVLSGQDERSAATLDARVDPELLRLNGAAALAVCVDAIQRAHGQGPITVTAADFATYQGRPAVMVFFTDAAGAQWGWAVGADCGPAGTDELFRSRVG